MTYIPPLHRHCYWCECVLDWDAKHRRIDPARCMSFPTRDHIVPRCEGGRKTVWSCHACNQLKGDMPPADWAMLLGKLKDNKVSIHELARRYGPRGREFWAAALETGFIESELTTE